MMREVTTESWHTHGREERSAAGEQRFNHLTGKGRVEPKPGDYSDALKKKHLVYLMHTETTGALSPTVTKILHTCAKAVTADPSLDSTIYGTNRASTRSFYAHHVAAISSAILRADATTLVNAATSLAFWATLGAATPSPA